MFAKAFADSDFDLVVCNSGEEALDIVDQHYIDFICSSYYLKDMDGAELCKKVRLLTKYSYKPFILMTSVISSDALLEVLPAGVTDIYHKNDLGQLLASIQRFPFFTGQINGRILYIEDDRAQRELTTAMLRSHGLDVDVFSSAESAWSEFLQNDYDVVITDIVLEGAMSGLVFVNQIRRQIGKKGDVPILAVTAFDDRTRRVKLFHLGVTEYIIKPVFEEELFIRIKSLISRRRAQEVGYEQRLADMVYKQSKEAVMITDRENQIIAVNPAFTEITGYTQEEVFGRSPDVLSSGRQQADFYQLMWSTLLKSGHWHGELSNRKKSGEIYLEALSISAIYDENNEPINFVGMFSDITRYKEQEKAIELLSYYDSLTGLPNRMLLSDRFAQAKHRSKATASKFALCAIDLDNFKQINELLDRGIGDQALIEVAERIKNVTKIDDTLSRMGGDQFVLLLNGIKDHAEGELFINALLESIAGEFLIKDKEVRLTASIGMTFYPDDNVELDTMLRHADHALYQAKLAGKNRWRIFDVTDDKETAAKQQTLKEIEDALVDNQFSLYYQPKVNMRTGEVVGLEALIRWIHPEKGLLPPCDFLPLIEHSHLEVKVGEWVINTALAQMDKWLNDGLQINVSVNISAYHLQAPYFSEILKQSLALHPMIDSRSLQLEILESGALGELAVISRIIQECKDELGVTIALDDFGTGYSSLSYLRNLPASLVKIDRSFVRDMLDDPNDYAIIDGIIGLSESFNLDVIAEGVETAEIGEMLLVMGCTLAQGYYISMPMSSNKVVEWVTTYQAPSAWKAEHYSSDIKKRKAMLFKLIGNQWMKRFIHNIEHDKSEQHLWPIMTPQSCPCGKWIKRAKMDGLYSENWLEQFQKQHEQVHHIAQAIFEEYQEGDITQARSQLSSLKSQFDALIKHLKV
jgi:diguanylate cyclase (GGDEF)-like protein/PAS domain S-box-containing protein